jgi:glycosyltransferase involved in cell wall biosynthesis
VVVIRNAIRPERFDHPDPAARGDLLDLVPVRGDGLLIVGAAGRLSPEKGVGVLVEAAAMVLRSVPSARFVVFGEGPLREDLTRRIVARGLQGRFLLPGFRDDLDRLLPAFDVFALPSFTEGLPNVALEASAAGVAVVATAVGGSPEAVDDGVNGLLVPSGDPAALAARLIEVLSDDDRRKALGRRGRDRVRDRFSFEGQALQYQRLFEQLQADRPARARS